MWYWRKAATRPWLRTLPFILLAIAHVTVFGVAGLFSSQVIKAAGNEALLRSDRCGTFNESDTNIYDADDRTRVLSTDTNMTLTASNYAQECYLAASSGGVCDSYIQRLLPMEPDYNASCPFGYGLCAWGSEGAFEMDSGYIDTHEMLGINARKRDRVHFRKVTTCSPLLTGDYEEETNITDRMSPTFGDTLSQFFFGPIINSTDNATFSYNEHSVIDGFGYNIK